MAKDSRFKYEYRKNASKLHRVVGEFLRTHFAFHLHQSFQEYHVNRVNTSYPNGAHRFDWVVPPLKLVIECHGLQHYKPVTFGGDAEKSITNFKDIQLRDKLKKDAALAAGWRYITVKYTEQNKVTGRLIFDKIKEADNELIVWKLEHDGDLSKISSKNDQAEIYRARQKVKRREYLKSDTHKAKLKQASEVRKKSYQAIKEQRENGPRQ